jgi:glycosyltransferase involved in cell wall biosynthesis
MPVYNAGRYLRQAVESILAQTFRQFELIAVDDGSTDDSKLILDELAARDARVRVISRPNTGIVGALNEALGAARGEFIARMDADDEAVPERFTLQLARMRADPRLVALGSSVTFMDADGNSVQPCPRVQTHAEIERDLLAGDGGALIHPAVMFRASALHEVGGYRAENQYLEDLDLFLGLARVGLLANLPESLLRYRVHPKSINFTKNAGRHALKLNLLRSAHETRGMIFDTAKYPDNTAETTDPARLYREWAVTSLAYGSRRVAIRHGLRAVRRTPRNLASWRALAYAIRAPKPRGAGLPSPRISADLAVSALNTPLQFSVLIAAYRAAPFLPAALRCVETQTHANWELIVVEDGSNDGTEALVRTFAAAHPQRRIVYDNLGENRGVAAARNRLLALAQGEAVAFLDADDEWQPGHLSDLNTVLLNGAGLAISGIELWDGDRAATMGTYLPPAEWLANPRRTLFEHSFIQTSSSVALRREVVQKTGTIDETLRIGEDRDYWFRALAHGSLGCTGRITCRYTKHAGSSMTKTLRVAADTAAFYRKYEDDASLPARLRRRLLADALLVHGRLLRESDRPLARRLLRSAVRTWPLAVRNWLHLAIT